MRLKGELFSEMSEIPHAVATLRRRLSNVGSAVEAYAAVDFVAESTWNVQAEMPSGELVMVDATPNARKFNLRVNPQGSFKELRNVPDTSLDDGLDMLEACPCDRVSEWSSQVSKKPEADAAAVLFF